jgi:hypothetical protein
MRLRPVAFLALGLAIAAIAPARDARAAANESRFNIVLSAMPSSVEGGDFNDAVDYLNGVLLAPRGNENLDKISFAFQYDIAARYMVRQNIAITAGIGQLRAQTKREFLPAIQQSVEIRGEILASPVQVGGAYYFQPYNQGDFRARGFLGGGFLSMINSRALFQLQETGTDSSTSYGGSFVTAAVRDAPGYYLEGGVHMFFASRYSVMLSGVYRSAKIEQMVDRETRLPVLDPTSGQPFTLDVSGLGLRAGVGIGF